MKDSKRRVTVTRDQDPAPSARSRAIAPRAWPREVMASGASTAANRKKSEGGSPAKGKRLGVCAFIAEAVRGHGYDRRACQRDEFKELAERVVETVRERFPDSRACASDVRIVLSQVRRGQR
jgi:hypothetical protein